MAVKPFPSRKRWDDFCLKSDTGKLLPVLANALAILRLDGAVMDLVAYDEMTRAIILEHPIGDPMRTGDDDFEPRPATDADIMELTEWMQNAGLCRISRTVVGDAVEVRAHERAFHPVRDYLGALQWDGQPRVDDWLTGRAVPVKDRYCCRVAASRASRGLRAAGQEGAC